jgi:hypothetical protein
LVCRLMHSQARWPLYCCSATSRLLKVNHCMLHVRIKMRLGAYASSRQDTDYAGAGGVVRSFDPGSVRRAPVGLSSVCIQAICRARPGSAALWPSRGCSSATTTFKTALKDSGTYGLGPAEESGTRLLCCQVCVET